MAITTNKMFLDKTGLTTLWGIITNKFATKAETITNVVKSETANNTTLQFTYADNTTEAPHTLDIVINAVNDTKAGLMTPVMLTKLNTAAAGTIANLKLKYLAADKNTNEGELKGKPVIQLWDGTKTLLTQLDATEFVKDGMLSSAELVVNPENLAAGTYLKLIWNTDSGKTDPMYVNVTSLIDVYKAGTNISISADKTINCTYSLPIANDNTLGGIQTGYTETTGVKTYAVKADSNGNAYVAVPWDNTEYSVTVQNDNLVKLGLSDTAFSIDETALTTRLSGIDTAVGSKIASVTGESGGNALISVDTDASSKAVTVASTTKLSTAVGLAETSIQGIGMPAGDVNIFNVNKTDNSNVVTLSAGPALKSAMTAAGSAVQSVKIGDLVFNKANNIASVTHDNFVGYFAMTEADIKDICK